MNPEQRRILIQKVSNLPTLPSVIHKIMEVADSTGGNAAALAEVLSKDPSLTSLILRLVNSAYYGQHRQITSIDHAIVILGFQLVKTIALGAGIFRDGAADGHANFDREAFWVHSLAVATGSKMLAEALPRDLDRDVFFLSGLLHDLGKVVFDNYFNDEYRKVIALTRLQNLWIRDAELRLMDMDHCKAGFYLARKWRFPQETAMAIRYHHDLSRVSGDEGIVCAAVHAADVICRRIKIGSGGDDQIIELDPSVSTYGITRDLLGEIERKLEAERENLQSFVAREP